MTKKESNDHGQKLWKKTAFPASKSGKAISGSVISFSILFLHCLNQWFHGFKHPNQTKNGQLSTVGNWSTFQQRINEELIAS